MSPTAIFKTKRSVRSRLPLRLRGGFALVLALSLMGFMMLLVMTLAALVQMQLRLSQHALLEQKAKQAAKFAAYQAMSRVQAALGPDRRITANASMFDSTLADGIGELETAAMSRYDWWNRPMGITRTDVADIEEAIGQNRHWVGVWDSRLGYSPDKIQREQDRSDYIQKTIDGAITWLVSGNFGNDPDDLVKSGNSEGVRYKPYEFLQKGEYVRLVSKGSYSNDSGEIRREEDVLAPLVELEKDPDPVSGETPGYKQQTRIAWWVADEGQKASLNAVASYEDIQKANTADKFRVQSLPFYSGIHGLTLMNLEGRAGQSAFSFEMDDNEDDTSSMSRIRRLDDVRDLDVYKGAEIPDNVSASKAFFHSVTFGSKGLLVNVRHGGMKKDLTLGLTRRDFGNEPDTIPEQAQSNNGTEGMYFELPMGVAGYEYKTTAYPLWSTTDSTLQRYRREPRTQNRMLQGKGHMFGPQMYGNEDLDSYETASALDEVQKSFDDIYLWKDTGGPLWDQLRSYYNLRVDNDPSASKTEVRMQTDDRVALKPVVKRFQVFYVPTFVRYNVSYSSRQTPNGGHPYNGAGGQAYGVRLHIIPLLVLWNPYDVKIPGESYYMIMLSSRTPMGTASRDQNPLGWYRFAIGYRSGNQFQCLRDLRTEMMPSLDVAALTTGPSPDVGTGEWNNWSTVRSYNPITDNVFKGLYVPFRYWGSWDQPMQENVRGSNLMQFDLNESSITSIKPYSKLMMSTKTFFNQIGAYPLGYGSIATYQTILNPPNLNNIKDVQANAWRAFVDENNLYPSLTEVYNRKQKIPNYWSARVAKVPLYLNNIPASTFRGKFDNRNNMDLFRMQRTVNVKNAYSYENNIPSGASNMNRADETLSDPSSLRFLVKDTNGIEPGKAKVFAMKHIINYMGNGRGTTANFYNGPNGDIEGSGTGTSPYERQEAMLYGLDDGGQLGNCFFIDVPHPENEHYLKYNNRSWDSSERRTPHVLFDLAVVSANRNHLRDSQGNYPPTSIDEYLIDMDDAAGNNWNFIEDRYQNYGSYISGGCFTLASRPNGTPVGYGFYIRNVWTRLSNSWLVAGGDNMTNSFYTYSYRNGSAYKYLDVDIWLWNKEGMRLVDTNESTFAEYSRQTPKIFYMRGMRPFLGEYLHSFPEPSMSIGTTSQVSGIHTTNSLRNFFSVGVVANAANSTTWLNPYDWTLANNIADARTLWGSDSIQGQNTGRYSLSLSGVGIADEFVTTAPTTDASGTTTLAVATDAVNERVANVDDSGNLTALPDIARYRYFLNWLGINSARHSANSWAVYNGIFTNQQIGDLAPQAFSPAYVVNSPTTYSYGASLHNAIVSNRDSVPYGFVFALPYADNDLGSEPLFNRRMFVSGSVLGTSFDHDGSTISNEQGMQIPQDDSAKTLLGEFGRTNKQLQGMSQVYGTENDGISENNAGYNLSNLKDGNQHMIIGLRQTTGTTTAPVHHILRRKEIVSNPANLSSVHLTFASGRSFLELYSGDDYSYGNGNPDGLGVDFAIGNSLCPYRIAPERSFYVQWIDGVTQQKNDINNASVTQPAGTLDYTREPTASRGGSADWPEDRFAIYDMSWHLNDILWDDYFFSTFPYRTDERDNMSETYVNPQNPRLVYYIPDNALREDVCFTPENFASNTLNEYVENSSKLWINGPFNVNSTDIDAWKAVLSTYCGTTVQSYNGSQGEASRTDAPFHRWAAPFEGRVFTSETSVDEEDTLFQGYRALSPDEIEQLAAAIVEHVKDRGPFYSMAHFVNRVAANYSAEDRFTDTFSNEQRLSLVPKMEKHDDRRYLDTEIKNDEVTYKITHMQKGVLQAAIDATEINSAFHRDPDLLIETGDDSRNMAESFKNDVRYRGMRDPKNVWENWRGAVGPQATGAPTYLMQQDLLARLGSFLTVRSDTFKIRAYGEVRNPISGIVEAKAWCEMTIQRVPDYIDQTVENQEAWRIYDREFEVGNNTYNSNPYSSEVPMDGLVSSELSDLNKTLGRRFKVVGFRWLAENEI